MGSRDIGTLRRLDVGGLAERLDSMTYAGNPAGAARAALGCAMAVARALSLLLSCALLAPAAPVVGATASCLPPGRWAAPVAGRVDLLPTDRALARLAQQQVVLLGESHESAEHHRWQLQTAAGLLALRPNLVLGFEMFPRRVQPALDRWVAGELTEEDFLAQADWARVWGVEPSLYLPLFHFARMNRIPVIALNVERSLVSRVNAEGWAAIGPGDREGVTDPAAATREYLLVLHNAFLAHAPGASGQPRAAPTEAELTEPAFRRFVESQLVWDRAMAQRLAERARDATAPLVVGILGSGHVGGGHGVPRQLRDLGVTAIAAALPWEDPSCAPLQPGLADVLFGVEAPRQAAAPPPRLGIAIEPHAAGVRVKEVTPGSVAAQAGLVAGDVITGAAGGPLKDPDALIRTVRRQLPGTILPLDVLRGAQRLEVLPRFPPRP